MIDTHGFLGQIKENTFIKTNDHNNETIKLQMAAYVQQPSITINPEFIFLKGLSEQIGSRSVEINSNVKKPLKLEADDFNLEGIISYRIEEIEKDNKFKIYFKTDEKVSVNAQGFLNLRTNYEERPILSIRIYVSISR